MVNGIRARLGAALKVRWVRIGAAATLLAAAIIASDTAMALAAPTPIGTYSDRRLKRAIRGI